MNWIACASPVPELNTEPVVWVKLPLMLSTLLPEEPVLPKLNAPLDIVTFPLTVVVGDPLPEVKTNFDVAPESVRFPAIVNAGDADEANLISLFCELLIVKLPLIAVRLPLKFKSAPGSDVRLMIRLP